jgi:hypothetical protein
MSTGAHRTTGRRVALPGLVVTALAAVALVAFLVPAGGSGSDSSPASSRTGVATVYPREVRVTDLIDATLRQTALDSTPPVTVLVEVAAGVYALPHSGPLGGVDDYTSVFGRCADVNRFGQSHAVARACY